MPVRVKVKIESMRNNKELVTVALLNTGFTSNELDILIPKNIAKELNLWPPPDDAILEVLDTAGGEVLSYLIPNSVKLTVLENDRVSKTIICNTIVSLHEKEVLLSDAVIEELEIEILSPWRGFWRFRGEGKIRESVGGLER